MTVETSESRAESGESWLTAGRFALVLGLLVAATFPRVLLGMQTFIVRDFGMFSFPVAQFYRESFWRGELPQWDPLNLCGVPFLAQWNTLVLYPPSLLYLLLPLTWSLPLFCLVHLFWGGLGMYRLAREWTGQALAAALGGVIFAFNGLTLTFLMWPSHVATFSWLPWVLWLAPGGWRQGGRKLVWAVAAGAMQMLAGGPETIILTWLLLGVLACGDWLSFKEKRRRILLRFGGLVLLVALVCAAQLLPFLELLAHSQRDSGYGAASHNWAMPLWGWANFLVPLFRTSPTAQGLFLQNTQYWATSYYAGIGTVWLGLAALRRGRGWRVGLLAVLVFLSLVLAWGDTSVLFCAVRACFPALGFVRYPVKFIILTLALAPLLAAFGLAALTERLPRLGRFEWGCGLALVALVGVILAVDWNASVPEDVRRATWQNGVSRAALLVVVVVVAALWLRARAGRRILLGGLLLGAFWLDLATQVPNQNPGVPPEVYAPDYARAHDTWKAAPEPGRSRALVSAAARQYLSRTPLRDGAENYLRNRLAARVDCNLLDHVPVVDGFFSLMPREAARVTALLEKPTAGDLGGLQDFMGVSQTTAPGSLTDWTARPKAMPLVTAGQQPVFADERCAFEALSASNSDFRKTVLLPLAARGVVSARRQAQAQVLGVEFANEKVLFQTKAPARSLVVIAQTWYPAWRAYVDGQPTRLWRANYAFQALEVPAGRHRVELVYRDRMFLAGLGLSALGIAACLALWRAIPR